MGIEGGRGLVFFVRFLGVIDCDLVLFGADWWLV